MRDKVSRQRKETAIHLGRRLLDPEWRSDAVRDDEGVANVVIALWNDPLQRALSLVDELGGEVSLAVRRPDGALISLRIRATDGPRPGEEEINAAPESTVGMLLDSLPDKSASFSLHVAESPLKRIEVALVS